MIGLQQYSLTRHPDAKPAPSKRERWGAIRRRVTLTNEQVRQARQMRREGMTYTAISAALDTPMRTIYDICNYKTRRSA